MMLMIVVGFVRFEGQLRKHLAITHLSAAEPNHWEWLRGDPGGGTICLVRPYALVG